jgi:hypothetical protein
VKAAGLALDILVGVSMLVWLFSGYLPNGRYNRPATNQVSSTKEGATHD